VGGKNKRGKKKWCQIRAGIRDSTKVDLSVIELGLSLG
jgi:hypothetical protein